MDIPSDQTTQDARIAQLQTRLRDATLASHRSTDHHPLLSTLVKPSLSPALYRRVLIAMAWLHLPLRRRMTQAMALHAPGAQFVPADRCSCLMEDFTWLGIASTPVPEGITDCFKLRITSAESLIGALYVTEGSLLGGQVITRKLAESIQVYPGKGASFFHGLGADTQLHWRNFWRFASTVCPIDRSDAATAAAIEMFKDVGRVLDTCLGLFENDLPTRPNKGALFCKT